MNILRASIPSNWLFIGALLIPLLLMLDAYLYYPALLRSGTLSSDSDSIGIPIIQTALGAFVLMPVLALYALPALWRYQDNANLLEFHPDRPWRQAFSIFLYAAPALFLLAEFAYRLTRRLPAYEYYNLVFTLPLVAWLVMLRGAMAAPREKSPN